MDYDSVKHFIKKVSLLNSHPKHCDRVVFATLNKKGRFYSKKEFMWSAITNDKLLLIMLMGNPQLQDLNPEILRAGSPQDQLTTGNLPRLDELKLLASRLPTSRVSVNLANESGDQAKDPGITWATTVGEVKKLPVECGPPKNDQSYTLKEKFEFSQFKPANQATPAMDTTKGCKNLVDSSARTKENCKSFSIADGYTYTLGYQEVAHYHS
ncbi:hypothetical protein DSO57_1023655 [Entomophthora muscae]|uniref:Uncharacterized protein n=1 Tax=Entomophthora muscae TaxID=34485 RepID=A0ACC2S4V0_9FUNG|nr:hypothetical protein DSO57_1023655 [Entomophthora muscae]